jgi:hypothetical protein
MKKFVLMIGWIRAGRALRRRETCHWPETPVDQNYYFLIFIIKLLIKEEMVIFNIVGSSILNDIIIKTLLNSINNEVFMIIINNIYFYK